MGVAVLCGVAQDEDDPTKPDALARQVGSQIVMITHLMLQDATFASGKQYQQVKFSAIRAGNIRRCLTWLSGVQYTPGSDGDFGTFALLRKRKLGV